MATVIVAQQVGIEHQPGQGVVDFMRDPGGDTPDGGVAFCLRERALRVEHLVGAFLHLTRKLIGQSVEAARIGPERAHHVHGHREQCREKTGPTQGRQFEDAGRGEKVGGRAAVEYPEADAPQRS